MKKNCTHPIDARWKNMDSTAIQASLERLERFLDTVDQVNDPNSLEEPFRSLWRRVHAMDPASVRPAPAVRSDGAMDLTPLAVEISPSKGVDPLKLESSGRGKRIEVLSPQEVGPTIEMKVEEKKLTFRMAGSKEIRSSELKREAGNLMIGLQSKLVPMTGLGGEVSALQDKMKLVARAYKDVDYEKAVALCREIGDALGSADLKKSILLKVQRRMTDYMELGADVSRAKEPFKAMATSLKEGRGDFYETVSKVVQTLEESIKGLKLEEVAAEVVEVAEVPEPPGGTEVVPEATSKAGKAKAPSEVRTGPTEVSGQVAPTISQADRANQKTPEPEIKPVVKIVKKRLTPVIETPSPPLTEKVSLEPSAQRRTVKRPKASTDTKPAVPVPRPVKGQPSEKKEATPEKRTGAVAEKPELSEPDSTEEEKSKRQKEAAEAFNRIQVVYRVATALHKKGRDVKQLFDLLGIAEEARKKGDLRTYSGVSRQLESMLLSMQGSQ